MHIGPGIGDAEGGHGDNFGDAVGFHCGYGVGVGVGHHAWGGDVGGEGVVCGAARVEGDDYCGGEVVGGCGDCFFNVCFLQRRTF